MTAKDIEQMLYLVEPWQVTSLEMDHAAHTVRLRGGGRRQRGSIPPPAKRMS